MAAFLSGIPCEPGWAIFCALWALVLTPRALSRGLRDGGLEGFIRAQYPGLGAGS